VITTFFVITTLMIGNIYSFIPMYRFIDKTNAQIAVKLARERVLVSNFTIEETAIMTRYTLLNTDNLRFGNLHSNCFSISRERFSISGDRMGLR